MCGDLGSSIDVIYWDILERLQLDLNDLKFFRGFVVGFLGGRVHVKGYISLKTLFGPKENINRIKVIYIVVGAPSSYNIILGKPNFKLLKATLSMLYLTMHYPLDNERVSIIKRDQKTA